jgi:hypothetical protein
MKASNFDRHEMERFGYNPNNEHDLTLWLETEPRQEALETTDYSQDAYEIGSDQSGDKEPLNLNELYAGTFEFMESVLAGNAHMYEVYEERHKPDGKPYDYHYQSMFVVADSDIPGILAERLRALQGKYQREHDALHIRLVPVDEVEERLVQLKQWAVQD